MKKFGVVVLVILTIMSIAAVVGFADFMDTMAKYHMVLTDLYTFADGDEVTICLSKKQVTPNEVLYPGNIKSWGEGTWHMTMYSWEEMLKNKDKNYKQLRTEIISWEW